MPRLPDFRTLFDHSPNPYMLLDRTFCYVAVNRAYLAVTGATAESLIGRNLFRAFPHDPADPENANARMLRVSLERVLATRETDVLAFIPYRVPASGEDAGAAGMRYWSATHTPLLDGDGEVEFILQHTVDITEIHQLREAREGTAAAQAGMRPPASIEAGVLGRAQQMQQQNVLLEEDLQRFRRLFDQAPGFMCFLSGPEHRFERANAAYLDMVGRSSIVGLPIREALPELGNQGYLELLDRVFTTGEPFVGHAMPVSLVRKGIGAAEERFVDFLYQPIVDARGAVTGILVLGYDITDQTRLARERNELLERERSARTEAERANRAKDEFLAMMSHELRSPLNAMLGWTRMLRGGSLAEDKWDRALESIERNARSQVALIEDVLDVARIESGKLRLEVTSVILPVLVAEAVEAMRPAADAKQIALEVSVEPDVGATRGDPNRLQQIVWNLVSNAVKFTEPGGSVQVHVERSERSVAIIVQDSGQGIEAEFLPYVFERFRQGDASMTRKHGGLGLGLAIVKHLVELHGGTVHATSPGAGAGATFTALIPTVAVQAHAPGGYDSHRATEPPTFQCPAALRGLTVLVVDDEPDARELLQSVPEHCDVRVLLAANVRDAITLLRAERPDVLVSDIGMPVEDGYALIRHVRGLGAADGGNTPAIAITAFARTEDRLRAITSGFNNHLAKPIDPSELLAVIASVTGPYSRRTSP